MNGWSLRVLLPVVLLALIAGAADAQPKSRKSSTAGSKKRQVHYATASGRVRESIAMS